jgi:hypothetical protein
LNFKVQQEFKFEFWRKTVLAIMIKPRTPLKWKIKM